MGCEVVRSISHPSPAGRGLHSMLYACVPVHVRTVLCICGSLLSDQHVAVIGIARGGVTYTHAPGITVPWRSRGDHIYTYKTTLHMHDTSFVSQTNSWLSGRNGLQGAPLVFALHGR